MCWAGELPELPSREGGFREHLQPHLHFMRGNVPIKHQSRLAKQSQLARQLEGGIPPYSEGAREVSLTLEPQANLGRCRAAEFCCVPVQAVVET